MDVVLSYDFLPRIGGAHMWLYEVYRRWPGPVRILTARYSDDLDEAASERSFDEQDHASAQIFRRATVRSIDLLSPRSLWAFASQAMQINRLRGKEITRVHASRAFPEGFAGWIYRRVRPRASRLITYAHGEELHIAKTSRQLLQIARVVYRDSDLVIVNSENTRKLVLELCADAKTVCIHPGVDAAAYVRPAAAVADYKRQLAWPAGTMIVATVARMEPRKNQATVMRAVAELRREGLPLAYVCAGDGEERPRLEALAATLGVEDWVRFPGRVSDQEKSLIFASADVHAMPSVEHGNLVEGFGIVFLEAGAAGIPSIAGNSGGQMEAVLSGRTGLVVDGSSLEDVCSALRSLSVNADLRHRMGEEGRAWALTHDWPNIMRQTWEAATRT